MIDINTIKEYKKFIDYLESSIDNAQTNYKYYNCQIINNTIYLTLRYKTSLPSCMITPDICLNMSIYDIINQESLQNEVKLAVKQKEDLRLDNLRKQQEVIDYAKNKGLDISCAILDTNNIFYQYRK